MDRKKYFQMFSKTVERRPTGLPINLWTNLFKPVNAVLNIDCKVFLRCKKNPKTFAIFSGQTTENICGWRQMHSTEMYATWRCYTHFSEDIRGSMWRGRKSLKAFFISNQTALTSTLTGDMSAGRPKKKKKSLSCLCLFSRVLMWSQWAESLWV